METTLKLRQTALQRPLLVITDRLEVMLSLCMLLVAASAQRSHLRKFEKKERKEKEQKGKALCFFVFVHIFILVYCYIYLFIYLFTLSHSDVSFVCTEPGNL